MRAGRRKTAQNHAVAKPPKSPSQLMELFLATARALLAAEVDRVTVAPSPGPANRFDPARITIVWRV